MRTTTKHRTLIRRFTVGALAALTLSATLATSAQAANPVPRPIKYGALGQDNSFPAALLTSIIVPTKNPAGANDWACKPTAAHPRPVVLVHGTVENAYDNWNGLSPIIKDQGYCVFALNFGNTTGIGFLNGTGDLISNAKEIGPFVDRVLAATGASKVDLVGHSQGGAIIRYYTNILDGAPKVSAVIGLAPSNHPTTLSGITNLGKTIGLFTPAMQGLNLLSLPAIAQQADQSPNPQSPFYQQVNDNGETIPGLEYTNIITKNDEIVTPPTQGFITAGPGASVDNITIQDVCKADQSEHVSLSYSKNVAQIILNKLDPTDVRPIRCFAQTPIFGNTQLFG